MTVEGAKSWIDRHLWMILTVVFGVGNGFLIGQATMAKDVDENRRDIAELRADFNDMHPRVK